MPSRLSAYGEIRQIGDAHALFGHKDYRLERTRDGRPGQFTLDVGMSGRSHRSNFPLVGNLWRRQA